MPLEGHWQRQNTPMSAEAPRVRRLVFVVAAIAVAAAIAGIALTASNGSRAVARGCIHMSVPSTTGGYFIDRCGADAIAYCRSTTGQPGSFAADVRAECRRRHIRA